MIQISRFEMVFPKIRAAKVWRSLKDPWRTTPDTCVNNNNNLTFLLEQLESLKSIQRLIKHFHDSQTYWKFP